MWVDLGSDFALGRDFEGYLSQGDWEVLIIIWLYWWSGSDWRWGVAFRGRQESGS